MREPCERGAPGPPVRLTTGESVSSAGHRTRERKSSSSSSSLRLCWRLVRDPGGRGRDEGVC